MVQFEGYERRIAKIEKCLAEYGFSSLEEMKAYTVEKGLDVDSIVRSIQPIAFENAVWAYTLGAAIALRRAARRLPTPQRRSASDCRHSASPAPSLIREKSAWATATWQPCCSAKKRIASASWPVMNPLPLQKEPSVSLRKPTRYERNLCVLS